MGHHLVGEGLASAYSDPVAFRMKEVFNAGRLAICGESGEPPLPPPGMGDGAELDPNPSAGGNDSHVLVNC